MRIEKIVENPRSNGVAITSKFDIIPEESRVLEIFILETGEDILEKSFLASEG